MPLSPSRHDVRDTCKRLGLSSDWSAHEKPPIPLEDARKILDALYPRIAVSPDAFRQGLSVELEHGRENAAANVTNNHPLLTGKIVLAHLLEFPDYYDRLEVAENEADLMHAISRQDWKTVKDLAESRI